MDFDACVANSASQVKSGLKRKRSRISSSPGTFPDIYAKNNIIITYFSINFKFYSRETWSASNSVEFRKARRTKKAEKQKGSNMGPDSMLSLNDNFFRNNQIHNNFILGPVVQLLPYRLGSSFNRNLVPDNCCASAYVSLNWNLERSLDINCLISSQPSYLY